MMTMTTTTVRADVVHAVRAVRRRGRGRCGGGCAARGDASHRAGHHQRHHDHDDADADADADAGHHHRQRASSSSQSSRWTTTRTTTMRRAASVRASCVGATTTRAYAAYAAFAAPGAGGRGARRGRTRAVGEPSAVDDETSENGSSSQSQSSSSQSQSSSSSGEWLNGSVFEEEKMKTSAGGGSEARDGGARAAMMMSGGANGDGDAASAATSSAMRVRDGTSRHDRSLSKPYAVFRIDAAGQRLPYKQIMTRRQLLRDTDLSPRDLRRIDPSLGQANNTPAVIVREDSVLVNLGVRVIIRADHALLLEPDTMMSVNFLESWTQRMSTAEKNQEVESLPFELVMVEASLQETCAQLANRLEHCTRRYRALERKLQTGIEKTTFDELRFMKQALVQLESRSAAIRDEILETLDDEDDVERMTLSSKATEAEDKEEEEEEVENLLEYYLQQCEAVHSATEALLENTRDLDESISVTLSARRLEVSKIELMLSIASFAAAVGAVVTGIFGMNLTSTLESSVVAFYLTTGLLVTACVGMSAWLYRLCRSRSIL